MGPMHGDAGLESRLKFRGGDGVSELGDADGDAVRVVREMPLRNACPDNLLCRRAVPAALESHCGLCVAGGARIGEKRLMMGHVHDCPTGIESLKRATYIIKQWDDDKKW